MGLLRTLRRDLTKPIFRWAGAALPPISETERRGRQEEHLLIVDCIMLKGLDRIAVAFDGVLVNLPSRWAAGQHRDSRNGKFREAAK